MKKVYGHGPLPRASEGNPCVEESVAVKAKAWRKACSVSITTVWSGEPGIKGESKTCCSCHRCWRTGFRIDYFDYNYYRLATTQAVRQYCWPRLVDNEIFASLVHAGWFLWTIHWVWTIVWKIQYIELHTCHNLGTSKFRISGKTGEGRHHKKEIALFFWPTATWETALNWCQYSH